MIRIDPKYRPSLDPEFVPAILWNRAFELLAQKHPGSRPVDILIGRPDGSVWSRELLLLPDEPACTPLNWRYVERIVKLLLWTWGGNEVVVSGAPDMAARLRACYSPDGERRFDEAFMGETCFLRPFLVVDGETDRGASPSRAGSSLGRHLDGCRIGFDLGGSDRKCAALIDGKVVFSEEVKWDPYFESDPQYHVAGIRDTLQRAAAQLPRVDAIGGSAAGIYINNEPRVASLFRGVNREDFNRSIRGIFHELRKEWGNVPLEVANGENAILGISMGTSLAAGYIDREGHITGWLNELAFAPVDYRNGAPVDEWSGDAGCGVQYFSQQAVGRLLPASGIEVEKNLPLPDKLEFVQQRLRAGDDRATRIYRTIGTCFGYSIAHYADIYDFDHLLLLGRVSSGEGGSLIMEEASRVLSGEFPQLAGRIRFQQPDEQMKRHGQAVAAASLPEIH